MAKNEVVVKDGYTWELKSHTDKLTFHALDMDVYVSAKTLYCFTPRAMDEFLREHILSPYGVFNRLRSRRIRRK